MFSMRSVILGLAALAAACGSSGAGGAPDRASEAQSPGQSAAAAPTAGQAESGVLPAGKGTNAPATLADTLWNFESVAVGTLPDGWKTEETRQRGQGALWEVRAEDGAASGHNVLRLVDTRGASGSTFNLAWTDRVRFLDGTVEVKVHAHTGREDQGGGPIWRVQDKDNYYICRWNPLENNFRVYYVQNGNRTMLETARVHALPDTWHTITIHQRGNRIEALLDGKLLLSATDDTFTGAGGVGVWTKADAASSFDDFVVKGAPQP